MQFFVYSRHAIEALPPHDVPHVVISITSSPADRARIRSSPQCRGVLRLSFSDVEGPGGDAIVFDASHARAICAFVAEHRGSIERIIVHCDAGFSRSPAVAAAIARCMGEDDAEFFARYAPNALVYRTLLDAWNAPEDLEHVLYAALLRNELTTLRDLRWECAQRGATTDREVVLRVVRRALSEGVVVAGEFTDGTFNPWSGSVDEIVSRVSATGDDALFRRSR